MWWNIVPLGSEWNVSLLQVSLLIRRELFDRAKDFNIILDDVAITELSFSHEYTAAVEAKQVGTWQRNTVRAGWLSDLQLISHILLFLLNWQRCSVIVVDQFVTVMCICSSPAQQEVQRAHFYVEKAKQDQRQKIIQAEGEAEAAKMVSQQELWWTRFCGPYRHDQHRTDGFWWFHFVFRHRVVF